MRNPREPDRCLSAMRENSSEIDLSGINAIHVPVKLDLAKSLRKLVKDDSILVIKAIFKTTPLDFAGIRTETSIPSKELSRILHELSTSGLLIKKDDQYYLTKYCLILLSAINQIKLDILNTSDKENDLFAPHAM